MKSARRHVVQSPCMRGCPEAGRYMRERDSACRMGRGASVDGNEHVCLGPCACAEVRPWAAWLNKKNVSNSTTRHKAQAAADSFARPRATLTKVVERDGLPEVDVRVRVEHVCVLVQHRDHRQVQPLKCRRGTSQDRSSAQQVRSGRDRSGQVGSSAWHRPRWPSSTCNGKGAASPLTQKHGPGVLGRCRTPLLPCSA